MVCSSRDEARVTHKFKNADKEKYKQHGYIASAEQLLGLSLSNEFKLDCLR
ncbi:hypothetical protein INT80_06910 [Gallibacterium anatis]|uniref:Uncharacterized protein n=1 Tax=Gallibacterium anatis TaxID=750 RepID=A0A930UW40_9PAST|nr:hypothetical protein [Gallibacterium anatis]